MVPFALFQFFYVYEISSEDFTIKLLVVPIVVATVFGSFIAKVILLRYELKKTQESFIQQAKMASLGHVVNSVAHEVNTPLGNTITLITLLQEEQKALSNEIQSPNPHKSFIVSSLENIEKSLAMMSTNMQQVATLVRNFKTISADNNDDLLTINLTEYIQSLIDTIRIQFKEQNIKISMNSEDDIRVNTYPSLLLQILNQCIYNASYHAFSGITSPEILISALRDNHRIIITIEDNGNGIDKELLAKIFDPFTMQSRKENRIGLGLSMVYNIVTQNLQGTITAQNHDHKGALFTITLPLAIKV